MPASHLLCSTSNSLFSLLPIRLHTASLFLRVLSLRVLLPCLHLAFSSPTLSFFVPIFKKCLRPICSLCGWQDKQKTMCKTQARVPATAVSEGLSTEQGPSPILSTIRPSACVKALGNVPELNSCMFLNPSSHLLVWKICWTCVWSLFWKKHRAPMSFSQCLPNYAKLLQNTALI